MSNVIFNFFLEKSIPLLNRYGKRNKGNNRKIVKCKISLYERDQGDGFTSHLWLYLSPLESTSFRIGSVISRQCFGCNASFFFNLCNCDNNTCYILSSQCSHVQEYFMKMLIQNGLVLFQSGSFKLIELIAIYGLRNSDC
jgi:hypothetical protein